MRREAVAQRVHGREQSLAQHVALGGTDNANGFHDDAGLHRGQRIREHVRITVVFRKLLHRR